MNIPQHLLTQEQLENAVQTTQAQRDIRKFTEARRAFHWARVVGWVVLDGDDGLIWVCPVWTAADLIDQGYCVASAQ